MTATVVKVLGRVENESGTSPQPLVNTFPCCELPLPAAYLWTMKQPIPMCCLGHRLPEDSQTLCVCVCVCVCVRERERERERERDRDRET